MTCNHAELATRYCPKCGVENPECTLDELVEALREFRDTHALKITAMQAEAWIERLVELMVST